MLFVHEVQEAVNLSDELSNLSLSHIRRGSFDCGYPAAQSDSLHLRRLPRIQSKGLARAVSRCRVPRPSKGSVSQPSHLRDRAWLFGFSVRLSGTRIWNLVFMLL